MHRRYGIATVAIAATAACALPMAASAKTKTVYAGGPPTLRALARTVGITRAFGKKYMPGINAFFNQTVTINQGDSVKWVGLATSFHTVDLPARGGKDLPFIVQGSTVTGVNDSAGSPFWFNGHVPSLGFNPKLFAPSGGKTYNGSARVESGLPAGPPKDTFKVTFTKPGMYKYFCDIHPGMIGYVVVKPKGKPVPTATQDATAIVKQATTDLKAAKKLPQTTLPADHVSLGLSTPGGVELYAMFPATLSVKAGTVVTFSMSRNSREAHTATVGPTAYLMTLANSFNGGPTPAQQALYPSDNPALGPISLGPTSHGNGFVGTGALDEDPTTPLPPSGQIKFTTAGTYQYICAIHPFMHGTIVVTP